MLSTSCGLCAPCGASVRTMPCGRPLRVVAVRTRARRISKPSTPPPAESRLDLRARCPAGHQRLCLRPRHVRGPRARSPAEPPQGAAAGRSGVGDLRRDGRVQARRRPRPGTGRDRDAAGPGDRRGPVHQRRLDARAGGPHRGDRGDGLPRTVDGADQPRAGRLERREGEADGRIGREAPRLLPPGRAERARPGAARGRRRRGVPGRRPGAVRRAALVLARRGREARSARRAGRS